MNPPEPKSEIAVSIINKSQMFISVTSSMDTIATIRAANVCSIYRGFDVVSSGDDFSMPPNNDYDLFIDPRYDFDEVLAWIKSLGE